MTPKRDEILWVEKYRPQTIQECILPVSLKAKFQAIVDKGELPNMILAGTPGTGKTTVAKALAKELNADFLQVNASEDGNIDTLRNKVRQYASTVSFTGGRKIVLFDEGDNLNASSTQPALRGFIEEFARNTGFIFTANKKFKIAGAIHSRCPVINFTFPKAERPALALKFLGRLNEILKAENVKCENQDVLIALITKSFPDMRRIIGDLQQEAQNGSISLGILASVEIKLSALIDALKKKDFSKVRSWVVENIDQDSDRIFRTIYDGLYESMQPKSIPQAILLLADYQYKAAFVADHEINLVACLTEIMVECEWK